MVIKNLVVVVYFMLLNIVYRRKTHTPNMYMVFRKEFYNGISNVNVWRVLRRRLHLKAYKLSIVKHLERFLICTPLSV
jgi:hypothetical protein